jgi:hypothetical protein
MAGLTASKKRKVAKEKLLTELKKARDEAACERRRADRLEVVAIPESPYGDGPPVVTIPAGYDGRTMLIPELKDREMMRNLYSHDQRFLSIHSTVLHFQVMTLVTRLGTHVRWFMPIEGR